MATQRGPQCASIVTANLFALDELTSSDSRYGHKDALILLLIYVLMYVYLNTVSFNLQRALTF